MLSIFLLVEVERFLWAEVGVAQRGRKRLSNLDRDARTVIVESL